MFHAETGGYDVQVVKDDRSPSRPMGKPVVRKYYRFQIQGPNAKPIIEKLNGGPFPDINSSTWVRSRSRAAPFERSGMHGGCTWPEIWGPYEEGDEVRAAIIEAGGNFGLQQVGRPRLRHQYPGIRVDSLAPASRLHGREDEDVSQWLPASGYEATGSLGGSFVSANIEDYYAQSL